MIKISQEVEKAKKGLETIKLQAASHRIDFCIVTYEKIWKTVKHTTPFWDLQKNQPPAQKTISFFKNIFLHFWKHGHHRKWFYEVPIFSDFLFLNFLSRYRFLRRDRFNLEIFSGKGVHFTCMFITSRQAKIAY